MKTKFLLPVLAMIIAIGMSFTTVNKSYDPSTDYIMIDDEFVSIETEVDNCGPALTDCLVQLEEDGPVYFIYDDQDPLTQKKGSGDVIRLWEN